MNLKEELRDRTGPNDPELDDDRPYAGEPMDPPDADPPQTDPPDPPDAGPGGDSYIEP